MHQLLLGAAPPWCLSSARTGLRVMPRLLPATPSLSVIRNSCALAQGGVEEGADSCRHLRVSHCLTAVPSRSRARSPLPSPASSTDCNCQLTFSADTESPVPAGEGRDQLSLLRAPASFPSFNFSPLLTTKCLRAMRQTWVT